MTKGLQDYFAGKYCEVDLDEEMAVVWWCRSDVELDEEDGGPLTDDEWQEIADTFNMDCHQGLSDLIYEITMDVIARRETCEE